MSNLKGKTALVTGGGTGIGEAIAIDLLAKAGVEVTIMTHNRFNYNDFLKKNWPIYAERRTLSSSKDPG